MPGGGQFQPKSFVASTVTPKVTAAVDNVKAAVNDRVAGAGRGLVNPPFVNPTNPMSHNTNNIVANSDDAGLDGHIDLSTAFVPNILDQYDTVTYHWKLFIVDNDASSTGRIFDTDSQTIIAESGVSDLTIDKVEIRSVCTPSIESGTGTSTHASFEIVEPAGAGLIDKIFYQSLALGIGNWSVMPIYLQLQFRGRSPETGEAEGGSPGTIGSLRWVYPLKLSSIQANVTTVGTRYDFQCTIYNEYTQSNAMFTLQHPVVLNSVTSFPNAMAKLQDQLNDDQFYQQISTNSIPDSYRIVVDPVFADPKYNITPINANTNTQRNSSTDKLENKNATFPAGTAIDKIIDSLLSNTNGFQNDIKNSNTPGAEGNPMNGEKSQMKKLWRIITETRPVKFDPSRCDYAKEHTIFVVQYDIGILDQSVFQDTSGPSTLESERRRLMTYVKKNILKKKYNYIFTGLNDQVINFDIKINNAFALATARMNGIYTNSAMMDKGIVTHDHAAEEAAVSRKIYQAVSLQNKASTASTTEKEAAIKDAQTAIQAATTIADSEKTRLLALLSQSKPESRLNYNKFLQTTGGIQNTVNLATSKVNGLTGISASTVLSNTLNTAKLNAKVNATPRSEKVTQSNLNFISNVDPGSKEAKDVYKNYVSELKGKLRPIARIDSLQQAQVGMGVDSNSNSGLQQLSSLFSVALHAGYGAGFAQTQLSIKGDPFWLFPQPYTSTDARIYNSLKDETEAIDYIKNAHARINNTNINGVNIFGSDNFILIRFRTPRVFNVDENPDTSNPNTDVETLSGVFKVISVVSKFENGKFHQDLVCNIDTNINILNFMDEIEADARKTSNPVSPDSLTLKSLLPSTAIATDRIMGGLSIKGIQSTVTSSVASAEQTLQSAVSFKGVSLGSNIPTSVSSLIPGLPNKFI